MLKVQVELSPADSISESDMFCSFGDLHSAKPLSLSALNRWQFFNENDVLYNPNYNTQIITRRKNMFGRPSRKCEILQP
jgi:hypothetical protein